MQSTGRSFQILMKLDSSEWVRKLDSDSLTKT